MSKYLLNKFLFTVDRDPDLVERYRTDPVATVQWWEAGEANRILNCISQDQSTWLRFEEAERAALAAQDYPKLFELGAHPFLTLTLFIAMFERDYPEPLGFQKDYASSAGALRAALSRHRRLTRPSGEKTMPDSAPAPARGPLDGLLVADFSWRPPVREGVATYYLAVNRNKRSVALDFKDEDDRAAARKLAARAHVVVENFKPGGLARFGLDYATVAAANPAVVYASISGFGSGKGAGLPGYDLMVQAISGLMSLTGDPEGSPYRAGISVFDVMSGMHATIGILAALRHREETGQGARLTYLSAPDSLQGAVAAGLLGGGSRFLGVTEDRARFLADALAGRSEQPTDDAGWDELATQVVSQARAARRIIPGLGHPVHKSGDPRTPALIALADQEGVGGPHLRLFQAIGRVHPEILGRSLPLNGAGVCGAALADLGLPVEMLRGFALLARTAGVLGHIAEEQRQPVGMDVYLTIDRNAKYRPPAPATSHVHANGTTRTSHDGGTS